MDKSLTPIAIVEVSSSPGSPASGIQVIYAKTDGELYVKNNAGTERKLNTALLYGTGSPPSPSGLPDGALYFKYTP